MRFQILVNWLNLNKQFAQSDKTANEQNVRRYFCTLLLLTYYTLFYILVPHSNKRSCPDYFYLFLCDQHYCTLFYVYIVRFHYISI